MTVLAAATALSSTAQAPLATVRDPWRNRNGATNQVATSGGVMFEGRVVRADSHGLLIQGTANGKQSQFLLVNFPYKAAKDEMIGAAHDLYAWPTGIVTDPTVTNKISMIRKFDYGKPCTPVPAQLPTAAEFADAKFESAKKKNTHYREAFKESHDLAVAGDVESQWKLGELYLSGHGCPVDTNEARIWLEKAAAGGNTNAIADLRILGMTIANTNRPH